MTRPDFLEKMKAHKGGLVKISFLSSKDSSTHPSIALLVDSKRSQGSSVFADLYFGGAIGRELLFLDECEIEFL
jgi:hypothetical protein